MNFLFPISALAAAACLLAAAPAGATIVSVGDSTSPWTGYMNVFELPVNGGGFVFGNGWGPADLVSTFDDGAGTLALSPNTIEDPAPFWYIGGGGPGQPGNKIMEANLYIEETGPLAGQSVTFQGNVLSNTLTPAHESWIFIKDFAPDYSSFVESRQQITATGPFSINLVTDPDPARHVQYGFQTVGENVWVTDTAPFGSVVIGTIPEPSGALLGLLGLGFLARRRR